MSDALTADCGSCAALCCMALAFDRGEDFGLDKPAGLPCPHLARHSCTIHDALEPRGFSGCVSYDCRGAGQRVTQEVFGGASWQDDPALLAPMIDAFADMRAVQDRRVLLSAAARLPLSRRDAAEVAALDAMLAPGALSTARLEGFARSELAARIDRFIASLRRYVPAR